jgi:hypothetical protein
MKTGTELITEERKEQVEKHGWNLKNDSDYSNEELLKAALFCVDQKRFEWPWFWQSKFRDKVLMKTRVEQLTEAGAFIAAEIDRIQELL